MHLALLGVEDSKLQHSQAFFLMVWSANFHPGLRHCWFWANPAKLDSISRVVKCQHIRSVGSSGGASQPLIFVFACPVQQLWIPSAHPFTALSFTHDPEALPKKQNLGFSK